MTDFVFHQLADVVITSVGANTGDRKPVPTRNRHLLGCVSTHQLAEGVPEAMPWYAGQPSP
jgi:hypothetical protein